MTAPLFSIIVPTYNRCDLLRQAVESVWNQMLPDYELIVVDDGSTDGTREYLRSIEYCVNVLYQANRGPGSARNRGIEAATGDWIVFLDSDDLWFPWTLIHLKAATVATGAALVFLKPFRFANVEALASLVAKADSHEVRWEVFKDYFASGEVWRWWGASSFAARRESIGNARFPEAFINGEDSDWLMKLGHGLRVVQLTGTPTFGYREHDGSLMANWDRTLAGANHLVSNELCGIYPGGEARRKERRRILGRHLRPVMLDALSRGQRADALGLMRHTWRWNVEERRFRFLAAFFFRLLTTR